jgi:signal transduction histidine kinase
VIMLTMLDGGDSVIEGLTAGADDYIAKSAGFNVIHARIESQIRRKRTEDARRRVRERLLHGERRAVEAEAAREIAKARASMAEQLERASAELDSANRELEALSHSVSFGLRAPLRGISGFARTLEEDLSRMLDEEHLDYLRRIQSSATRMGELIDSLLELARVDDVPLQPRRVDVVSLVASVVEGLASDEREVEVRVAPGLTLHGDPQLVRILFANLLSNSWKFTARTPEAAIEIGSSEERTYFVRDNGLGFDSSNADRLFLPFQRMHPGAEFAGLGVGLAIVRRIIERHGGRIWAESVVGAGATFYFTLS